MLKKINNLLHTPNWLFALLVIILILRVPSFFEPYSYGDELIYLSLGEAVRQGIPLYSGIHDNKPPLLYITAAIAGNLFWFKAILAFWSLITIYIFWKLSSVLFSGKDKTQIVSTTIFAVFTTIPLLEGNIVNAELFMIGPTMLGFYLLLSRKSTTSSLAAAGVLFSIATLYKIPAFFDVPAIVFYWICTQKGLNRESLTKIAKKTLVLLTAFLAPIALTFIWYYLQGAFKEYLVAAFLQNFGYLSSWRPDDVQKPFLIRNGPLLLRTGIVVLSGLIIFLNRKKTSKGFLFSVFWLFLTLFAVTLSERPYPHYLIQSVAPAAMLFSILFTSQRVEQVYTIIPLFFLFLVPYYFNFWHYETLSYYKRFVSYASGQISTEEYLRTFGSHVKRNYTLSEYITSLTTENEKIFVWGDGVPVYALSKRLPPIKYVADYHIKDFSTTSEVIEKLSLRMPTFIIVLPDSEHSPELNHFIKSNYGQTDVIEGAQIWKLLGPKVRSLLSF